MQVTSTSRLQKIIANRDYCSRRKAEELILAGRVKVDGIIISKLGEKFPDDCELRIDDKKVESKMKTTLLLFKPKGYVCSKEDPHNPENIMQLIPEPLSHLNYAGRLDKDSEGIVILSGDGDLIFRLTHPKFGHTKTYEIQVRGKPTKEDLLPLKSGKMQLDDKILNPIDFEILAPGKIRLILSEGRKRQIRRLMDSLGFPVLYLCRTAIGRLQLTGLKPGEWKELSEEEIQKALS